MLLLRRHFTVSRDYALPHPTSRTNVANRSSTHVQHTFPPKAPHRVITANNFPCRKQHFFLLHCSYGLILLRRHFNATRDYALFIPHQIRVKGRLLDISPYFTHVTIKGPSYQPTTFFEQKNLLLLTIAETDVFYCEDTSTQVATLRTLLHTISGSKVAYVTSAHVFPTLLSRAPHNRQQVSLHKKIFCY